MTQESTHHRTSSHEEATSTPRPARVADRRHIWFSIPLLIAVLGLIGTGIGALTQMYANNLLERHKFESSLVQEALSASTEDERALRLKFMNEVGLLSGLNKKALDNAVSKKDGEHLPVFLGAAIRDKLISIKQAKGALSIIKCNEGPTEEKCYGGPLDSNADLSYRIAVMRFQRANKLEIDGYIGPKTVLALWEACPECPGLLQALVDTSKPPNE